MKVNRRELLFAGGLSMLAGRHAFGQRTSAVLRDSQSQKLASASARLLDALQQNRQSFEISNGPGWDWIVGEARNAHFTLIGEEHGVVETAEFSAALFNALRGGGYSRMAIELSPIIDSFLRLKEASTKAWERNQQNPSPENLFLFSQDPAVASAVRTAWSKPDRESDIILRTLEESLAIGAAARTSSGWDHSQRRALWNRNNLVARLKEESGSGSPLKVVMKFGYNHMIRGANYVNVFDLGAMADEVAALNGGNALHILVLPGPGSHQAVLGPGRSFVTVSSDEFDEFQAGDQRLTHVLSNPKATGHEVINLRALRPLASRGLDAWNPDVVRTIHGYDVAVIWKGAHASSAVS